jgi:hypothetical protein
MEFFIESQPMGPDNEKGEILSTWKEIAAYLDSGVRTCIRWEKENGLPVHRQEGAPRSRIFAYKSELDAWFKSRLGNGTIHPEAGAHQKPVWKKTYVLTIMALVLIGAAVGMFFIFRPRTAAPAKAAANGVPQSTGTFEVSPVDLVETEFAGSGRLRVWRSRNSADPFEAWRIEPVRHTTFAMGNLDEDANIELAAPGHCREYEKPGDLATSKIRFFINAYKYGFKDWWKTTFYDPTQCVIEKDNYEFTETVIADVDNVPGNEVVLLTAHALSIFKFDEKTGEMRLACTRKTFIDNVNTLMRSVVVADIDGDGLSEIVATAHEGEEGAESPGKGWLFVLRWQDGGPAVSRVEALPGMTSARALKIGDVVPGGPKEAVLAIYRVVKGVKYGYVVGWTFDGGFIFEKLIDEVGEGQYGGIFLAVGNLSAGPGDEVLVGRNNPNEIISFFWRDNGLVQGPKIGFDANARINNVQIGPSRRKDYYSSVLVNGMGEQEGRQGKFFLELLNFSDGFFPEWIRLGGEKEDLRVSYAAFAAPRTP